MFVRFCSAAIQEIANTRREALTHAFIQALVRGGPNGIPRPIDIHAADPMRYLGDMLAWVHQAHASEIELLDTLFTDGPNSNHNDNSFTRRLSYIYILLLT